MRGQRLVGRRQEPAPILVIYGTRPEAIKLGPVVEALSQSEALARPILAFTGQHDDLARAADRLFALDPDYSLESLVPGQPLNHLCSRILERLEPVLDAERPAMAIVQGDTTSALAGALAAANKGIPVAHVEAGLRTHNRRSPFPEEINRQLITRLASLHCAPTRANRDTLIAEGVEPNSIVVTGNPVLDGLARALKAPLTPSESATLSRIGGARRLIVLTTHRRESFGPCMRENMSVIRGFIDRHPDTSLAFPVHPNPSVSRPARHLFEDHPRVHLLPHLNYPAFVQLMARAWLLVSDSGGVQEEAPTLKRPLIVLREHTERPEAVECGVARLTGGSPERLRELLENAEADRAWFEQVGRVQNPFGQGDSGKRIARAVMAKLRAEPEVITELAS